MTRFSDPNYKLLSDYFNTLLVQGTGVDNSYLIGPNKTVVSQGGLYTILYEDNADRGYVGHRFIIDEIDGNRFIMTYQGLESTFSIASSAFDIGNDFYFRKDSFFHYWLARSDIDNSYHNYANQEKTFLYFGKIWPDSSGINKYSIQFEGLKDFALNALPQHQQTVNMTEWLKVYWDQVHHEMYNMTKNFWSMLDAREIDIRWLGYIASIYGIDISEEILNEISLREWVENLPYFLKRIGTYNALYIVWKVFMQNTQNQLNVYERWGEWCTQTLDAEFGDVVDTFIDHHFLEFYGIQPSGGAGDFYYSHYNPDDYPTHTLTAPNSCETYSYDLGQSKNFLLTTYSNLTSYVGEIKEESIEVTGYDTQTTTTSVMYFDDESYSGDFTHSIGIEMDAATSGASNLVFWAMSNEIDQMSDMTGDFISLRFGRDSIGGTRYFQLAEYESGVLVNSDDSTFAYQADKAYYMIIIRNGSTLSVSIFDRERKWVDDLVETISITLNDVDTYSNLYVLNAYREVGHEEWYGKVYAIYTSNVNYTKTISASGSLVMTPHYKVQIDLSTEPLGDIFDDDSIISNNVITELRTNFEYVRPVNRFALYEELIAPLGRVDRTGDSIPLYPLQSNGFFNTFFTGSYYISAGGNTGAGGVNTDSYFQQFASKTWTVNHNVNSDYLLVQPWVFTGINADNAVMISPKSVKIIDSNTIQIIWNESYRGIVAIAGDVGDSGVSYTEQISAANTTWTFNHNLDTNTTPGSGYFSPPGPVAMHWDGNGYRILPEINDMTTDDQFQATWGTAISGGSLIRRSDYIHTQDTASTTWTINHNLNSFVVIQFYRTDPSIENDREMYPLTVIAVDENTVSVTWEFAVRGHAHVVQVPRNRVVYSPYTCDEFGLGICPEVLGYWKVGTGEDTLWNPFNENDLESPVASGTIYRIEDDLNNIYIDFFVPKIAGEFDIKEVGLFNYTDDLIIYSRSSGLYKLDDVQTYFHYRLTKINSSSSSSSSSSISESSSSSSQSTA